MTEILKIGVVGAGQMGQGIAQVAAHEAHCEVVLFDVVAGAAEKAVSAVCDRLSRASEKSPRQKSDFLASSNRLGVASDVGQFASCDLVIEAVREDVKIKEDLFGRLDAVLGPNAIIASNTSSISITRLGGATKRPGLVVGMHFMNPVPVMKLVEVIPGVATTPATTAAVEALALRMGKTTVRGVDTPGFIVNRILVPMVNEAVFLLQEGVTREAIDTAMKLGTHHPMGPLTLADFVGLDTLLAILRVLHQELGEDKYRPCPLLVRYVEAGWLGNKVGKGFYDYPR